MMKKDNVTKILVVCMGNICRSPTGEAVLKHLAQQHGVAIKVDSAGTIGFHAGNPPDKRSQQAALKRGYNFQGIYARQVTVQDFDDFDLILAADNHNMTDLKAICPKHLHYKLALFLQYGEQNTIEIPDPYYGAENGFETVLDLIEAASVVIIKKIAQPTKISPL
ncbi:protein-tyrosine phosphatase [Pseudoalteromonas tunicata]|jgi:protein-tyrosine phosphatase|nr:low molecular weight protein-tyrosine-phosphatase [Pseudoalteromonas tunicata]ATC95105.1 protein-tyrosine phosphatase [Pseudoalteromonas tunicata]